MNTISKLTLSITVSAITSFGALAYETYTTNGVTWAYTVKSRKVTIGTGKWFEPAITNTTSGTIEIPSSIKGYPVTGIDFTAFYGCDSIECVIIPEGVTRISTYAFKGCSSLKRVALPASLMHPGPGMFVGCTSLSEIDVDESNEFLSVVDGMLFSSKGKTLAVGVNRPEVAIPEGVTRIMGCAFENHDRLRKVTLPSSLTHIEGNAFEDCENLVTVEGGEHLESVGYNAFVGTLFLYNEDSWEDVWSNEDYSNGYGLDFVRLGNFIVGIRGSLAEAWEESYYDETLNRWVRPLVDGWEYELVIPEWATGFAEQLFFGLPITSIGSFGNVTSIPFESFFDCEHLGSVTISSSVREIGDGAFRDCVNLTNVIWQADVTSVAFDSNLFSDTQYEIPFTLIINEQGVLTDFIGECPRNVVIPDGVTEIGSYAFSACDSLVSVSIPEGVRSIGYEAFARCSSLSKINIPDSVTYIGMDAFYKCNQIYDTTTLPPIRLVDGWVTGGFEDTSDRHLDLTGIRGIGDFAFRYCNWLESVLIPSNVTKIASHAFNGCISLTNVVIATGVEAIGESAFKECSSLKTISIPATVKEIGDCAFYSCDNLRSATGGENLERVGYSAFYGTLFLYNEDSWDDVWANDDYSNRYGLDLVKIGNFIVDRRGSLADVSLELYYDEESGQLKKDSSDEEGYHLVIPEGTSGIADRLFEYLPITSVTVPGSVKRIPVGAFLGSGIDELTLCNGIETIEGYAFCQTFLKSVKIPETVSSVGEDAFCCWYGLPNVEFESSDTAFDSTAFRSFSPDVTSGEWNSASSFVSPTNLNPFAFEKTGYRFSGWRTEAYNGADRSLERFFDGADCVTPFVSTNYYGYWTEDDYWCGYKVHPVVVANKYNVLFNANGANGQMMPMTISYDDDIALKANEFYQPSCDFLGWAVTPDGEVVYRDCARVKNLSSVDGDAINLYAVWTPKSIWHITNAVDGESDIGLDSDESFGMHEGDDSAKFDASSVHVYDGFIVAVDGKVSGSIQVKVLKANRKTGAAKLIATVEMQGQKKQRMKGETVNGRDINLVTKDGRELHLNLYASALSGTFDGMFVEGGRNVFTDKDSVSKEFANRMMSEYKGAYTVALLSDGLANAFSIEVKNKGRVKVTGILSDGTKVSANSQLIVGSKGCVVPVSYSRKQTTVSFALWLKSAGVVEVGNYDDSLCDEVVVSKHGDSVLSANAKFKIKKFSDDAFNAINAEVLESLLPETEVVQMGTKFIVAKSGRVKYKNGELITIGENLAGLRLSYKSKTGMFTGSFNVYALVKNKLKKYSAKVTGVMVDDIAYGTAVIKKPNVKWGIAIE